MRPISAPRLENTPPSLIDAGLDILKPAQISARGMQPERLKIEFGDRLCLWGGYVFSQVHDIQVNVPPENIVAMFEAVRDAGRY